MKYYNYDELKNTIITLEYLINEFESNSEGRTTKPKVENLIFAKNIINDILDDYLLKYNLFKDNLIDYQANKNMVITLTLENVESYTFSSSDIISIYASQLVNNNLCNLFIVKIRKEADYLIYDIDDQQTTVFERITDSNDICYISVKDDEGRKLEFDLPWSDVTYNNGYQYCEIDKDKNLCIIVTPDEDRMKLMNFFYKVYNRNA